MQSLKLFFPIFSLVLVFILLSCKKDKVVDSVPPCPTTYIENYTFDTVFPSDYLMTYPDSWWEYSDGVIDSCYSWEETSVNRATYQGNCKTITKDKQILPFTNYGHILYDSYLSTYLNNESVINKYLDTVVGIFINENYSVYGTNGQDNGYHKTRKKEVVELFDTFTVGATTYSDVIHVHELDSTYYFHVYNGPYWRKDSYYAKNVGLIRVSSSFVGQPYITRDLVNYYIAPH